MKKIATVLILLFSLLALAGNCGAISTANSGPFTVSVDLPFMTASSPKETASSDGQRYTLYNFEAGDNAAIFIKDYQNDFLGTDLTAHIKTVYSQSPIDQDKIQVKAKTIDGKKGATANAKNPDNGITVYAAMYLNDPETLVTIICSDKELFDNMVKSIGVEKSESTDSGSDIFGSSDETDDTAISISNTIPFAGFVGDNSLTFEYQGSKDLFGVNFDSYESTDVKNAKIFIVNGKADITDKINLGEIAVATFLTDESLSINEKSIKAIPYPIDGTEGVIARANSTSGQKSYYSIAYMPDSETLCIATTISVKILATLVDGLHVERIKNGNDQFDPDQVDEPADINDEFDPLYTPVPIPYEESLFAKIA